jgi:hypothetical protein
MSYKSKSTNIHDETGLSITHISDLRFGTPTPRSSMLEYNKNVFLIVLPGIPFFHFLNDVLGQYGILKKYIPDLEIFCLIYDSEKMNKFTVEVLKEFDVPEENLLSIDSRKVFNFKNVFYIYNYYMGILREHEMLLPPTLVDPSFNNYQTGSISSMVERFKKYQQRGAATKKIFISRKKENEKLRRLKALAENNKNKELSWFFNDQNEEFQSLSITESVQRYVSLEDELKIEEYFKQKGYEIVDPSKLSYAQQVFLYNSSTHVAGIAGAGLYNTIHCKPDTKVFIINTSDIYRFWHDYFPKSATKNVYSIPEIDINKNKYFSADEIISIIENENRYPI